MQEFCPNIARCYNRLALFFDVANLPAKSTGNQSERFLKTSVACLSLIEEQGELRRLHAAADLALEWFSSCGGIDHALNVDRAHVPTYTCEAERQDIHDESWIHSGADNASAVTATDRIKPGCHFRLPQMREEEFFAGRDNGDTTLRDRLYLDKGIFESRHGRMKNNVRL
jgi:hypothetical protein